MPSSPPLYILLFVIHFVLVTQHSLSSMALEPSIFHCKPFFLLLLLLLLFISSSSSSSSNFEISTEHCMEIPSSYAAAFAESHYFRASASFSISGGAADAAVAVEWDEMGEMLADAAARLARSGRYIVAAAVLRAHRDELAHLRNMTILAPDDRSIADAIYYASPPRFHLHVVPDRLLTHADLLCLPIWAELPTLDPTESLVVTSNGGSVGSSETVRLNFVGIQSPDLVVDSRIAVHGVHLPISEFKLWPVLPTPPPPSSSSSPNSAASSHGVYVI